MTLSHYILDAEGNPVIVQTLDAEGKANLENLNKVEDCWRDPRRQVAETYFLNETIRVSTVFLCAYVFEDEQSTSYQTKVFADDSILGRLSDTYKNYATKDDAIEGHRQICASIVELI